MHTNAEGVARILWKDGTGRAMVWGRSQVIKGRMLHPPVVCVKHNASKTGPRHAVNKLRDNLGHRQPASLMS